MFVVKFGDFVLTEEFKTKLEAEEWLDSWRTCATTDISNAGKIMLDPKTFGQSEGSFLYVDEVFKAN